MDFTKVTDWLKTLYAPQRPVTVEVAGQHYAVKVDGTIGDPLHPVLPIAPVATPLLSLSTLTGLVATFIANIDGFSEKGAVAVQVESYDQVAIVSLAADEFGRRHVWARAKSTEVNGFEFGQYMESEPFTIKLQAGFVPDANTQNILRLSSCLTTGSSVQVADDGFSQSIVAKEGGVQTGEVVIPPRLDLQPYRTFREITPVTSTFLLRFKAVKDGLPLCALIAVDAGRWKVDTAWAVQAWLKSALSEGTVLIA